jgi:hypothetical protein
MMVLQRLPALVLVQGDILVCSLVCNLVCNLDHDLALVLDGNLALDLALVLASSPVHLALLKVRSA